MTPEQLVEHSPRLYHLTPTPHIESIRQHGLLSTSALLDRFGVSGDDRERLEAARRARPKAFEHPAWGRVVLRDQHPLTAAGLRRARAGSMSVEEWLRLINSRVFFFPSHERLDRLASAYAGEDQSVLVIDTDHLLRRHVEGVEISHMNTGATAPVAHPRGSDTFRPLHEYPFDERRRKYGRTRAFAEVVIRWAVPDIDASLIDVHRWRAGSSS